MRKTLRRAGPPRAAAQRIIPNAISKAPPGTTGAKAAIHGSAVKGRASEAGRRRVRTVAVKEFDAPPLAGTFAHGGDRAPEQPLARPVLAPAAGEPDLAFGAFQRGYYLTAMELALARAERGDPAAQTLIGELYSRGWGVGQDRDTALSWYKLAADGGDRAAQYAYASLLAAGAERGAPRPRAVRHYMERAAEAGHREAQFNLAQMIVADRPSFAGFERALPLYRAAAEAGLPDAQYAYATLLAEGSGMPVADMERARTWMERAARNGFDTAQVELGIWMVNGRGGPANPDEGRQWLRRAAAGGNAVARNRLAHMHAFGIAGTPVDPVQAGAWHVLTRRTGLTDASMDRKFQTYSPDVRKRAIKLANRWQRGAGG